MPRRMLVLVSGPASPDFSAQMTKRIFFDGLNLARVQGTGIATYTRLLAKLARGMGHETGVLYSTRRAPSRNPMLREITFFDERRGVGMPLFAEACKYVGDHLSSLAPARPVPMDLNGVVVTRQFEQRLPVFDHYFLSRNVFDRAARRFDLTGDFLPVEFGVRPDIMHCTYQMPLYAKGACNVVTIHDLVPLRLPFTTSENKRRTWRLLRTLARKADHIVTVSENSRRDIIEILGVGEDRVTNTFQAVSFPEKYTARPQTLAMEELSGSLGLEYQEYLLFFGALEPKKNIVRIVDAYLASQADIPLVLVTSPGWENGAETSLLAQRERQQEALQEDGRLKRRIVRLEYASLSTLVTLIRGARAVLFPSLYEGFGLPVLEAMALGTPVITAHTSSLPEVAGDAALLVDPYDSDDISRAITQIAQDQDLRAELSRRGIAQAEKFSVDRYRERLVALYDKLI